VAPRGCLAERLILPAAPFSKRTRSVMVGCTRQYGGAYFYMVA
jgi:hypothetical protein